MNARKITLMAVLIAGSIILSIFDSFIPSFVPGMKLGLANIIILIALYTLGIKEAIIINLLRVYLSALLKGTIFNVGFLMSLSGAIFSILIMIVFKLIFKNKISIITVSILGAIFHSGGQILVAILYFETFNMVFYLPILSLISVVTGVLMGVIAKQVIKTNIIQKQKNKYDF